MANGQWTIKEGNMLGSKGETILILILVMTVALAIGLSIVQKSLVDVSTASKVEQSSRAFSAAEAGIEKALQESTSTLHSPFPSFTDNSSSVTSIMDTGLIPPVPDVPLTAIGVRQDALEIPNIGKEEIAQVWLANFNSTANPPPAHYQQPTLEVYWGNNPQDQPAIELTLVHWDASLYNARKWYLDPVASRDNGFTKVSCNGGNRPYRGLSDYQCRFDIPLPASNWPILLRARMLYKASQPIAVGSAVDCPSNATSCTSYSLPPQARVIVSTGVAGETQRRVKVFQQIKVIPPFFDYAIFSAGDIIK